MAALQADGWVMPDDPRDAWIRRQPDGLMEMRFEREVPRPPEKVWAALTVPERVADWLGTPIQIDGHVGGKFVVAFAHGGEDMVEATIVACDPPRLLALEWGDSIIRWEMTPTASGCRMVFHQTGLDTWWFMGGAAGWMGMIDDIVAIACGAGAKEIEGGYRAAVDRYRRAYGRFVPGHDARPVLRHFESSAFVMPEGGGRYTLRYSRRSMLPITRLWSALTEAERLADWLGVAHIDLRVGGEVEIRWPTRAAAVRYFIRELEAPTLMLWANADDPQESVRWRLVQKDPDFAGTRLVLTAAGVPTEDLLSVAIGWHAHLHELPEAALRGTPLPWSAEREQARAILMQAELTPRYRGRVARDAPDAV